MDRSIKRIVFAGTPEIAAFVLSGLLARKHPVVAVYTQPDRPSGRGRVMQESPVKQVALASRLSVFDPASLKTPEAQLVLADLKPDLMVVLAYGLLLPEAILKIPRLGCWNLHVSLLPRWRGAAPIQRAIEAGDTTTGVTLMQMDKGLDTGEILLQHPQEIFPTDSAKDLQQRLSKLALGVLLEGLFLQEKGLLIAKPQREDGVTYAHKIAKADGKINWSRSSAEIVNQIRAFNPWPVCETKFVNQTLRIWQALALTQTVSEKPGVILKINQEGIDVACGSGVVRLLSVQLPGKSVLTVAQLLNGQRHLFSVGMAAESV